MSSCRKLRQSALGAVFFIAALSFAGAAGAEEGLSWSITETLVFEWHAETDSQRAGTAETAHDQDNYLTLQNRANIGARRGPLNITLRFDQSAFWNTCDAMPSQGATVNDVLGCSSPRNGIHENDFRIERATARLSLGRHRLWVGDFPLQVGRGIVLSLRKVNEFGIDDALRGARLQLRLHDAVRFDVFGGVVNISNLDDVTDVLQEDPRDLVAGGRIEGRILDVATVGAHGVMLFPESSDATLESDLYQGTWTAVVGGTVEFPSIADTLSLYFEGDALIRNFTPLPHQADLAEPAGDPDEGFALYSTIDVALGRFTLLGEFKWYSNFQVIGTAYQHLSADTPTEWLSRAPRPYASPPTIEREDQNISNNTDVIGGRLRMDVRLPAGFMLYWNTAFVGGRSAEANNTFHTFAGLEYRAGGPVSGTVSGGYRREFRYQTEPDADGEPVEHWDNGPAWDNLVLQLFHGELSLTTRLVGRHSLHLSYKHETWDEHAWFHRGTVTLSYDFGSTVSVSVAYEYDTQFEENSYYIDDCEEGVVHEVSTGVRQHFGFAEVRYAPLRWLDLRLRGGTQRGGLRCLSGVCRVFPNFTGVRFESVIRF